MKTSHEYMADLIDLEPGLLYGEDPRWLFRWGDRLVAFGIVFEVVRSEDGDYPYTVEAQIMARPEDIDEDVLASLEDWPADREAAVLSVYRQLGGIPFNVDAVQPPKSSCGMSSFVADSAIKQSSGMEVRHFRDQEEARRFIKDFYAVYAYVLAGFMDEILSSTLAAGGTGRDRLRCLLKDSYASRE